MLYYHNFKLKLKMIGTICKETTMFIEKLTQHLFHSVNQTKHEQIFAAQNCLGIFSQQNNVYKIDSQIIFHQTFRINLCVLN